jgi:hypothetical protein
MDVEGYICVLTEWRQIVCAVLVQYSVLYSVLCAVLVQYSVL